jgi:hypothetical protein
MPTASDAVARGEWGTVTPAVDATPERARHPEWHSLRLFGAGRRPGAFDSGVETRHEL